MLKIVSKSIVVLIALLAFNNATMDNDSINGFRIGELFAYNDFAGLCKSPVQFVLAKRKNVPCKWVVAADFARKNVTDESALPVSDMNKDCLFSCDYKSETPQFIAEDIIDKYFSKSDAPSRSDYDIYTYLSPCDKAIRGDNTSDHKSFFRGFAGVYFSSNPDSCDAKDAKEIDDADILRSGHVTGLYAAQKSTFVDLKEVESKAKEVLDSTIKLANLKKTNIWLYKAVANYLDQHPNGSDS
eukprot:gene14419-15926_t